MSVHKEREIDYRETDICHRSDTEHQQRGREIYRDITYFQSEIERQKEREREIERGRKGEREDVRERGTEAETDNRREID